MRISVLHYFNVRVLDDISYTRTLFKIGIEFKN